MAKDVIIACDMPDRESVMGFLDRFGGEQPWVKIGMELFYAEGPEIVREIKRARLPYLPRPQALRHTQHRARRDALPARPGRGHNQPARLRRGGHDARRRRGPDGRRRRAETKLIAVTILTSTSEEALHREVLIDRPLADACIAYAENAKARGPRRRGLLPAGEPGHTRALRRGLPHRHAGRALRRRGKGRPGARHHAGEGRELGSDYIVMGRPITGAADPVAAWERARAEFLGGNA